MAAYLNLFYPLASSPVLRAGEDASKSIQVLKIKYKNITTSAKGASIQVTKFSDIVNIIIPFFEKYLIHGQILNIKKKWFK